MAINRYSRGPIPTHVQSQFIPLPLDLIDRQIQRRQSSYDKAKMAISSSQDAVYGVQGMSQDTKALQDITAGYTQKVDKAVEGAGDDYSKLTGFADEMASNINRDIQSGHLGAIKNNFIKAQGHMKDLTERYKEGKISKAGYDKGLNSISGFGGTVEDGKGGYTRASFYDPVKYLEIGKTADEYGTKINDQYDREGKKFINVNTATTQIEDNLWNNPQVIANAKEQLWAAYGDRLQEGTPQYNAALKSYVKGVAKDSAKKLAYHQVFKDTGINNTTNNVESSFDTLDFMGKRHKGVRFGVDGKDFNQIIQEAKDKGEESVFQVIEKWLPKIGTALAASQGAHPGQEVLKAGEEKYKEIEEKNLIRNDKNLRMAVAEISKSDLAKDIARAQGVTLDPETITVDQLTRLVDTYNTVNNSSLHTRAVNLEKNPRFKEDFKYNMNSGLFIEKEIINTRTGVPLTIDEKVALHSYIKEQKEGYGYGYGGKVPLGSGQGYGPGTEFFTSAYIDDDSIDDDDRAMYAISSPQSNLDPNSEWMEDRIRAAGSLNAVSFYHGGKQVVLKKDMTQGVPGVRMYRDGKSITQKEYYGQGSDKPLFIPLTQ